MPTAETEAPPAGAYISDGKYRVDAKGGAAFGTYKVEITGYAAKPHSKRTPADPEFEGNQEQFVPPQYNVQSKLELEVQPGEGAQVRDFEL